MPHKGETFNTQTFGKMYLFVICMISRHWFQTKLYPNLEILGQKRHFSTL